MTAFDRYSSGIPRETHPAVTVIAGDFADRSKLADAIHGQDNVFHFLSTTSPSTAEADPSYDLRSNVIPTVEMLSLCVYAGVDHIYFASSGGAIYGDYGTELHAENDATRPRSPYAVGKLAIEGYLEYFHAVHGLDYTSLRISNPYGPRQHRQKQQGLIPIALRSIAAGKPVTRYGDGGMTRDYIHVEDAVRMILDIVGGTPRHAIYNIGSGSAHSVNDVLDAIAEVVGRPFDIVARPTPKSFVESSVLDITRFSDEFGVPRLRTLHDGIADTWSAVEDENA